jgi:hypothetical protein
MSITRVVRSAPEIWGFLMPEIYNLQIKKLKKQILYFQHNICSEVLTVQFILLFPVPWKHCLNHPY